MWQLESVEINGGFLSGTRLELPDALTCIIGPRGSGKSTLAELIRFLFRGTAGLSKPRLDLLQANLGSTGLVTIKARTDSGVAYTISRGLKQTPIITTSEGRPIDVVDLDRGTFLPIDTYSASEIESIADEQLGEKRRALIDELVGPELSAIQFRLSDQKRLLEANADQIRAHRRKLADLSEQIAELSDAPARLAALDPLPQVAASEPLAAANKQEQLNAKEAQNTRETTAWLEQIAITLDRLNSQLRDGSQVSVVETASANTDILLHVQSDIHSILPSAATLLESARIEVQRAIARIEESLATLADRHTKQRAKFALLIQENAEASALIQERMSLDGQVAALENAVALKATTAKALENLFGDRISAKQDYLNERERISQLREAVASELQAEAGDNVRIRVMRHADDLAYRNALLNGLRGARVRNHEDLLRALLTLRPEHLAQVLELKDHPALDQLLSFGLERSERIVEALRDKIDPLELEIIPIEDRVRIELNVAPGPEPIYKDASELSKGQKCTALLPLLLARRDAPLVIDQPEDNLDNHFIYETIVAAVSRRKATRQMIFITHNANIPVLGEAELVVVMNSDGKIGFIELAGSVDQCQDEIVDLLEGGRKAFQLRSERYARSG